MNAGRFYGTAKLDMIGRNDKVDKLFLRLTVSNFGAPSYQCVKYLAELLSKLSNIEYTLQSSREFMEHIKTKAVHREYHLIFFDGISLFTNVSLDATIDIVLKRSDDNKEVNRTIDKREMKELIKLCTTDVHFYFDVVIYVQKHGVAIG